MEDTLPEQPPYDPECYLCPGNPRVSGAVNPTYESVFVFDNDHPVVGDAAPDVTPHPTAPGLYPVEPARGVARVVCYDPRHNATISDVSPARVEEVMQTLQDQVLDLQARDSVRFMLVFENKGTITGVSNLHPHCQIYATSFVFKNISCEIEAVQAHRETTGRNLFEDILSVEDGDPCRVVAENEWAVAFIPFFARYPYEVWVFPRKRHATLATLLPEEIGGLARVYQELNRRYDGLFDISFPYVMCLYQAPVDGRPHPAYHLHFVFLPPLRQPGVRKFPAGPELGGGNYMCDALPEVTAATLQAVDHSRWKETP